MFYFKSMMSIHFTEVQKSCSIITQKPLYFEIEIIGMFPAPCCLGLRLVKVKVTVKSSESDKLFEFRAFHRPSENGPV